MSTHKGRTEQPRPGQKLTERDFENVVRLTPLVSIDLIVRSRDRRVLLGRRTNAPARNTFFVPGGRITKNETLAMAFRRITLQELGEERASEEARFVGVYEHIYRGNPFGKAGFGAHHVVLAYELSLKAGASSLPAEQHAAYAWKTEAQILSSSTVHENTKKYFR